MDNKWIEGVLESVKPLEISGTDQWRFNWDLHLLTYCIFQFGAAHIDYFTTQWYAEEMSNWPSITKNYIFVIFCYCSFCSTLLLRVHKWILTEFQTKKMRCQKRHLPKRVTWDCAWSPDLWMTTFDYKAIAQVTFQTIVV